MNGKGKAPKRARAAPARPAKSPWDWRCEIGMLADRIATLSAGDPDAQNAVAVLRAAADPKWSKLAEMARKATHWIETNNRGARSRAQEADMLARRMEIERSAGTDPDELAEQTIRRLRSLPRLSADTCVPRSGVAWSEEDRAKALRAVARVIERSDDPEQTVRNVLGALGSRRASNAYKHRDARSKREK